MTESDQQHIIDSEHLKLLSWAYLASGCFTLLYSFVPGFLLVLFGGAALSGGFAPAKQGEALFPFLFIASFVAVAFLLSALLGGLKIYAGICIRARRRRLFCLVVAAASCFAVPYGTILGVATFYVLQRESVMTGFDQATSATVRTSPPDAQRGTAPHP